MIGSKVLALTLIVSILVLTALCVIVQAQNDSTVAIVATAGGTTNPVPGVYVLANSTQLTLTAMPLNSWQFAHWVILGTPANHGVYSLTVIPTDNQYLVGCGYGSTYTYQQMFNPADYTQPTATPNVTATPSGTLGAKISTETTILISFVVVITIILIALGIYASRNK